MIEVLSSSIFLEGNKVVRPNEKYSQNVESSSKQRVADMYCILLFFLVLFYLFSGESAVEALWDAEDDYENAINSFEKAFQWESSSSTEIISKTGELAPIHASLTDVRNPDRKLSLGQLLDEIDTPKCHLVQ